MSRRLPSNWLPRHWYLPRHLRHPLARYRLAPSAAAALAAAGAAALAGAAACRPAARARRGPGAGQRQRAASASASATAGERHGQPAERERQQPGIGVSSCTASGLRVRLDTAAAGVAAGSYFVPLEFTNISGQACELAGYPAVALTMGLSGAQVGARAATDHAVAAARWCWPPAASRTPGSRC